MWQNPQETADLITFTEEILNGKLYFLCSETATTTRYHYRGISFDYRKCFFDGWCYVETEAV